MSHNCTVWKKIKLCDLLDLTGCSGNGRPIRCPLCQAACECFGGWRGAHCGRIPVNGGGDPHLETIDGKKQHVRLVCHMLEFRVVIRGSKSASN